MAETPPHDPETEATSVFSPVRSLVMPALELPDHFAYDTRLQMDGLEFLAHLPEGKFPVAFLDPQYRGLLDKMSYGNEGRSRNRGRSSMRQMDDEKITAFIRGIDRALMPSGHLFLWMDKFHLCTGFSHWLTETKLAVVDLVTWDKGRIGMGYRTRREKRTLGGFAKDAAPCQGRLEDARHSGCVGGNGPARCGDAPQAGGIARRAHRRGYKPWGRRDRSGGGEFFRAGSLPPAESRLPGLRYRGLVSLR